MNPSSLKFQRTGKMTLLFAILCVTILNGMEIEPEWKDIANASNQKDFTRLVHLLANKSNTGTSEIAKKVNTDTAKKYIEIGEAVLHAFYYVDMENNMLNFRDYCEEPILSIKINDVDANYTKTMYHPMTGKPFIGSLLWDHINFKLDQTIGIIKFLINHGATIKEDSYYTVRSEYPTWYFREIRRLLAQARVNQ